MKILMTTDCIGGVWTYSLDLVRELTAMGHEVVLAVMGVTPTSDQRDELAALGVHASARPYRLEWMDQATDDVAAAAEWLLDLAAEHQPDLVHCNQFDVAALPWPSPVLVVAHSDVVTWWRAVHGCDPPQQWDVYREGVARGLAAAALVVAPTRAMLADLQAAYDVAPPTAVVHNGRRIALNGARKQQRLVAVGRVWDKAKNLRAAAAAASSLPWPLDVVGEGADAALDGTEGVHWLGRMAADEVVGVLARASIFVEPARYEPFGLAALEAGLAGCALVLGNIPSLREVWGDAATYVDPGDQAGLRSCLHALIDDPGLLTKRGRAAAERAVTFDPATMAAGYEAHYRRLITASRRPSRTAS